MLSRLLVTTRGLLADYPVVIAFLAAGVYRPHADAHREGAVAATGFTGGRTGAELREGKAHPEASKQLDDGDTEQVKYQYRQY